MALVLLFGCRGWCVCFVAWLVCFWVLFRFMRFEVVVVLYRYGLCLVSVIAF